MNERLLRPRLAGEWSYLSLRKMLSNQELCHKRRLRTDIVLSRIRSLAESAAAEERKNRKQKRKSVRYGLWVGG